MELLGRELAADHDSLRAVGRDILEVEGLPFNSLGVGLARGADDPIEVWRHLREIYLVDPSKIRQDNLLSGFIQQLDSSNPLVAEEVRVECRDTQALRRAYRLFLSRGVLDSRELEHVIEIAAESGTPAWQFSDVSWREERELSNEDRVRLLRVILAKTGGPEQVIHSLTMLRHVEGSTLEHWPETLREIGLDAVIEIISAEDINPTKDARVARALAACLRGDEGNGASRVMDAVVDRAARRYGSTYDVERVLAILAERTPEVFLNRVFPDDAGEPSLRFRDGRRRRPLSHVPAESLIDWCRENPDRWTRVAPQIFPFSSGIDEDRGAGTITPLASAVLEAAPHPEELVGAYLQHLTPMSWSGSRAEIMESRLGVIEALQDHAAPEVARAISRLAPGARSTIARIRETEHGEDRERDQRFE